MHINTTTKQTMEDYIYQILNITDIKLDDLLTKCYKLHQVNHPIFMLDDQYDYFYKYVKEHVVKELDEVVFSHLSRRVDEDDNGYSFDHILTKETSLSNYLGEYGITFKYDQHIKMYINNEEVILGHDEAGRYLKERFRHNYAFSGVAFSDAIEESEYYEIAIGGPEFFGKLYPYFDNDDLVDHFIEKSIFYQLDYLVPIEDIEFVGYEELNQQEKQYHLLAKVLQRLYFYKYEPDFIKEENTVMMFQSSKILSYQYLINKNEI